MTVLEMTRGDDAVFELTIRDAANVALNLVGASLWFTVKRAVSEPDADAIALKTIGAGITVVDAAAGRADVRLLPEDTAALPGQRAKLVWDCQLKDAAAGISTVDSGILIVEPDVTRATA